MITFSKVHRIIEREYYLRSTPSARRDFLVDHWGETDITKVMPITGITHQSGTILFRFTFSDGTPGALRTRVPQ